MVSQKENGIRYRLIDNALTDIEDFEKAQDLSDDLVTEPKKLHGRTYKGFNFFSMNTDFRGTITVILG